LYKRITVSALKMDSLLLRLWRLLTSLLGTYFYQIGIVPTFAFTKYLCGAE